MLEFFKQPGIYEVSLFFLGILVYKLLNYVFAIIHMYKYYREVGESAFRVLLATYLVALTGLEYKERHLRESQMDEKQIKNIIEQDQKEIDTWRDISLQGLYNFSPKVFQGIREKFNGEG